MQQFARLELRFAALHSSRAAGGRLIPPLGHVPGGYTVVTCHWSPVVTCLLSCPLVTTCHASATLLTAESRDFAVCHSLPCPRAEKVSDTPVRIRMSDCRTPRHAPRASLAPSTAAVLRDGVHWPRTTADPVAVLREPPAPHSEPRDSPRHVGGGCARRPRPDAPDGAAPRLPMGLIWPGESTPKGRLALPPCSPASPAPKPTVARLVCRRCAPSPSPGSAEMRRVSRRSGVFRGARSLDRSGGGPNVFRSGQGCGNGRLPGVPLRLLAVRHSNRGSHGNSRGNELHAISHNARQPNQTGINVL